LWLRRWTALRIDDMAMCGVLFRFGSCPGEVLEAAKILAEMRR
jgi:hypothetical protein